MQKVVVVKRGAGWYVRYRTPELITNKHGKQVRREVWKKVAPADISKRDAEIQAQSIVNRANTVQTANNEQSSAVLADYIQHVYFPTIEKPDTPETRNPFAKRPSTVFGYRHLFSKHIKPRLGQIRLFEFQPNDGQTLMTRIAQETGLAHNSVKHIKHLLVGIFTFAQLNGHVSFAENPMKNVIAQGAEPQEDTYAYNLDEIASMMEVLPEPARTVVATAAFTGLRRSELRGLRWEDLDGDKLHVRRTVWNTLVANTTKTKASMAPVPVVPMLRDLLEAHRNGFPADGFIFAGEKLGRPLNLSNLARRVIAPTLKTTKVQWHGWHGFRRGLATNLYAVGAPENMIQDILRHADLKVTRQFYIKPQTAQTAKPALKKLAAAFQVARKNARNAVGRNRIKTA